MPISKIFPWCRPGHRLVDEDAAAAALGPATKADEMTRSSQGWLDGLKRRTRPVPPTVQVLPSYTRTKIHPTPPRATFDTRGRVRQPALDARMPAELKPKLATTATVAADGNAGTGAPSEAGRVLHDREAAAGEILGLFTPEQPGRAARRGRIGPMSQLREQLLPPDVDRRRADAQALTQQLMQLAGTGDGAAMDAFIRPLSVARALQRVTKGDPQRALAALRARAGEDLRPEAQRDGLALLVELVSSDLGYEALQALDPQVALAALGGTGVRASAQPGLVAQALAQVTRGDPPRALAAMQSLRGEDTGPQAREDAQALQVRMMAAGLELPGLHEAGLPGGAVDGLDDPVHAVIRSDATRLALQATGHLARQVAGHREAPVNAGQVLALANAMLPEPLRLAGVPVLEGEAAAAMVATAARKGGERAARALVCAAALQADPAAMPPQELREAYFDWRNGFRSDGPGSNLDKAQARLFKLNAYARRAAGIGTRSWLSRVLGRGKSPLSGLELGSAGARLRNPEEDFARLDAIDPLVEHLHGQIHARAGQRLDAAGKATVIRQALRAAAAARYKEAIGRKGWRDEIRLSSTMRGHIVQDALLKLHGCPDIRLADIKACEAYRLLKKEGGITTQTLEAWGREELAPVLADAGQAVGAALEQIGQLRRQLDDDGAAPVVSDPQQVHEQRARLQHCGAILQGLARLHGLDNNGDSFPPNATPRDVLDLLRDVLLNARLTFDVRYADGGSHGVVANVAQVIQDIASFTAVPVVAVAPDVKLLRGRQALVNVGSSPHGGTLFVGTDTRRAGHLGVSATGGWSLLMGWLAATVGGQFIPVSHERSAPRGTIIRTRLRSTGPQAPAPDPLAHPYALDKLAQVYDTVVTGRDGTSQPADRKEMWSHLAGRFFKDPDVSVGWMSAKASSTRSSAGVGVGARASYAGYKAGPMASVGGTWNWGTWLDGRDHGGSMPVHTTAHATGKGAVVSGSLVATPAPQGDFTTQPGMVDQVALPNLPLVGATVPLLGSSAGVTLRIARDGDRLIPDATYRDVEFGHVEDFLQYVDSRNAQWVASAAASGTDGGTGAGTDGQQALNDWLTQVKGNADRGAMIFCERQRMTPDAARRIDALREEHQRRFPPDGKVSPAHAAALRQLRQEESGILADPASWRNACLLVMEADGVQVARGLNYVLHAQTQTGVSHLHMTAQLGA